MLNPTSERAFGFRIERSNSKISLTIQLVIDNYGHFASNAISKLIGCKEDFYKSGGSEWRFAHKHFAPQTVR